MTKAGTAARQVGKRRHPCWPSKGGDDLFSNEWNQTSIPFQWTLVLPWGLVGQSWVPETPSQMAALAVLSSPGS